MCGIAGFTGDGRGMDLEASIAAMRHRGPDASGIWRDTGPDGRRTELGHARLSILDLTDAANQPFVDSDGHHVIVFNGEIYNHEAVRRELQQLGHVFRTRSDTEVLLRAWIEWQERCLARLDGMFAFVVFDRRSGGFWLARDPFGIKPLYYRISPDGGTLAFASEIRALSSLTGHTPEPDPACFGEFLLNGFLYEPSTGVRDVAKLPPGCFASFTGRAGGLRVERYDDPTRASSGSIEHSIADAMSLQTLADVKVGLFFSGGIDSTVLAVTSANRPDGLFVDYGDGSGDAPFARDIADRIGLPLRIVSLPSEAGGTEPILEEFRRVAYGTEEPISDYTYVAAEQIAREARLQGCKVMLSGMGGDELFAGYPRHRAIAHASLFRGASRLARPFSGVLRRAPGLQKKLDRFVRFGAIDDFGMAYTSLVGYFGPQEVTGLLGSDAGVTRFAGRIEALDRPNRSLSPLHRAMQLDRLGFLAHNLTVTDRSSMAHGVEVRVPLLTPQLGQLSAGLAPGRMIDLRHTKKPLRNILLRHLPRSVVDRRKVGFNPPLDGRIATIGRARLSAELDASGLPGVVDMGRVRTLVDEHFGGEANHSYRLWQLAYFGFWLQAIRTAPAHRVY